MPSTRLFFVHILCFAPLTAFLPLEWFCKATTGRALDFDERDTEG